MEENTQIDIVGNNVSMSNQITRASHELRLDEKRLICLALSQIDSISGRDLLMSKHRNGFSVKVEAEQYASTFGLEKTTGYQQLQAASARLFERHIRYESKTSRGHTTVHNIRWVSSAHYTKGEGWVQLNFTAEIAPHLLGLRLNFTSYKLEHAADLDSIYAWRLFELLKSWQSTGRYTVSLDEFHKVMETPPSFQKNFKDLRVRLIEPAVESINARTNLIVQYAAVKNGKKVVGLEFRFIPKPQEKITASAPHS